MLSVYFRILDLHNLAMCHGAIPDVRFMPELEPKALN